MSEQSTRPVLTDNVKEYKETVRQYNIKMSDLNSSFSNTNTYFGNELNIESAKYRVSQGMNFIREREATIFKARQLADLLAKYIDAGFAEESEAYDLALYRHNHSF